MVTVVRSCRCPLPVDYARLRYRFTHAHARVAFTTAVAGYLYFTHHLHVLLPHLRLLPLRFPVWILRLLYVLLHGFYLCRTPRSVIWFGSRLPVTVYILRLLYVTTLPRILRLRLLLRSSFRLHILHIRTLVTHYGCGSHVHTRACVLPARLPRYACVWLQYAFCYPPYVVCLVAGYTALVYGLAFAHTFTLTCALHHLCTRVCWFAFHVTFCGSFAVAAFLRCRALRAVGCRVPAVHCLPPLPDTLVHTFGLRFPVTLRFTPTPCGYTRTYRTGLPYARLRLRARRIRLHHYSSVLPLHVLVYGYRYAVHHTYLVRLPYCHLPTVIRFTPVVPVTAGFTAHARFVPHTAVLFGLGYGSYHAPPLRFACRLPGHVAARFALRSHAHHVLPTVHTVTTTVVTFTVYYLLFMPAVFPFTRYALVLPRLVCRVL